jgi:acetate---CoA ligase (ADP-forming)
MPIADLNDAVGTLSEYRSKQILTAYGIPGVGDVLCQSADDAVAAASRLGYPVVLKASAPDLAHKTELGLVRLDLRDEAAVRASFGDLMSSARAGAPGPIDGILVAPFVRGGIETIVGLSDDPLLGPLVLLGLGGTLVEALGAVTWRSCPIDLAEAESMIDEVPALATLLRGVRGAPPSDRAALAEALVALSRIPSKLGDRLETVDVNPLLVRAEGQGVVALDALVVLKGS